MKISILDLGTSSFKHYIFEISGTHKSLAYYTRDSTVQLGQHPEQISAETQERAIALLESWKHKNDQEGVEQTRLIGTDILRNAQNAQEVASKIKDIYSAEVEILSHEQEAFYLYRGLRDVVPVGSVFAAINGGGGSTEIIVGNSQELLHAIKVPFGVNRLRNEFGNVPDAQWNDMESFIDREVSVPGMKIDYFFTTGIYDFLVTIGPKIGFTYDVCDLPEHPILIPIERYKENLEVLRQTPIEKLQGMYEKNPHYADSFAVGQTLYYTVAKKFAVPFVVPSTFEFTDGVVAEMITKG